MKWIKIAEAAAISGFSRQTIRNWIDGGVLPKKMIRGIFYVDKDMLMKVLDDAGDVEDARSKLEELKTTYIKESEEYKQLISFQRDKVALNRYLSICVNSAVRTQFFRSVVSMLEVTGVLDCREGDFLTKLLEGEDFSVIGRKYGLNRERVRQIADKAIRKSNDLSAIKKLYADNIDLKLQNNVLKAEIEVLRKRAQVIEAEVSKEEQHELEGLRQLFAIQIVDCDISVRAMNILKGGGIDTIGDLCRLNRLDYLKYRNAGKKTLIELENLLASMNLSFGMDVDSIYLKGIKTVTK